MIRFFCRAARDSSASVAVEFALLLPVYIAVIFGIIEFGRMIWIRNTLEFAAEQAARYGAVRSASATAATIETYARSQMLGIDPADANLDFTVTPCGTTVTVVGTYNFTTLVAAYVPIPATTLTVTGTFAC